MYFANEPVSFEFFFSQQLVHNNFFHRVYLPLDFTGHLPVHTVSCTFFSVPLAALCSTRCRSEAKRHACLIFLTCSVFILSFSLIFVLLPWASRLRKTCQRDLIYEPSGIYSGLQYLPLNLASFGSAFFCVGMFSIGPLLLVSLFFLPSFLPIRDQGNHGCRPQRWNGGSQAIQTLFIM